MSTRFVGKPNIGDIVYEPFNPNKYGKIISILNEDLILGQSAGYWIVEVKWKDGTITKVSTLGDISNLETLANDHARKATKFQQYISNAKTF